MRNDDELTKLEMLLFGTDVAIPNQEKRGQQEFNASEVLPKDCKGCTREQLESLGITFGKDVDDLFVEARLPAGWKKQATSHSMWSELVDDKGRARAQIFYKAAFYDRSAHMHLSCRYSYNGNYPVTGYGDNYDFEADREGVVTDQGRVIWRTARKTKRDSSLKLVDEIEAEAKAWLEQRYPDWRNPLAYWDAAATDAEPGGTP
jgi:hypothetical protein